MIRTQRLILKPIDEDDALAIVKWRNTPDIMNGLFSNSGVTYDEHMSWFRKYIISSSRVEFVIIKIEDNKEIGTIGLSNMDNIAKKAEYGIMLGEKDEWGKGYAKEASIAILEYGFTQLNLMKIYLKAFEDNESALKLYEKVGFKREGLLRKEVLKNGEYKDVVVMAILKDEWDMEYEKHSNKG